MNNEFDFINNIKGRYGLKAIGDDCAVLPKDDRTDMLITADMLVENIDFRLEWVVPEFLGHKALAVSLSDIAAMGGTPKWALLSIGVPDSLWRSDLVDRFYEGWHSLAASFNVELVGGDISRVGSDLVIDSVCGGEVAKGKALLRSGAKPGDSIYLTGPIGGADAGLKLLESGSRCQPKDISLESTLTLKQLRPHPQLIIGKYLQQNDLASASIDLSDGISSDLFHICESSGVGAVLNADRIPITIFPQAKNPQIQFSTALILEALNMGEDYELLFTSSKDLTGNVHQFYKIGTITGEPGKIELLSNGETIPIHPQGYSHF